MTNLVNHAIRELTLIGEEQAVIDGTVSIIDEFNKMGHSGGSAAVYIPMLTELLSYKNLSPLTDDPDEWEHHSGDVWGTPGGIWQNRRNSEAFSADGGKTYYLLSEDRAEAGAFPPKRTHVWHESKPMRLKPVE